MTPIGIAANSNVKREVPKNISDIEEPSKGDVVVRRAPGDLTTENSVEERRSALPQIPIPNIFALPR